MKQTTLQEIGSRIYRVRGQQVMLDVDIAKLYGVSVGRLNEAVRRNHQRFPIDFMFQLSLMEWNRLRSQFASLNLKSQFAISSSEWGGRRHAPYAFTEQGIAMLSSVLRSEKAIQVNIAIIRTFVKLRHALLAHQGIARRIEKLEGKMDMHETDIRLLIQDVDQLKKRPGPSGPINPSLL